MIKIFSLCISAFLIIGCTSLLNIQDDIKPGMPQKEISSMLGKPKYKRFNPDFEEWEYREIVPDRGENVLIVTFQNGKVYSMNSYFDNITGGFNNNFITVKPSPVIVLPSGNTTHYKPMNNNEFKKLYIRIKEESFSSDRQKIIERAIKNNTITCKQCAQILELYNFDSDKLKIIELMTNRISDIDNIKTILNKLTFTISKDKAMELLLE